MEKREHQRHGLEVPVVFSPFNAERKYWGVLKNYGTAGVYLEAGHYLHTKTPVLVRLLESGRREEGLPAPRTHSLGEVRWVRQLNGAGESAFGYGIKYY